MKLDMFEVVRLKDGNEAVVVEIYNGGEAYEAEVIIQKADIKANPPHMGKREMRTIYPSDIKTVFERVEKPFVYA